MCPSQSELVAGEFDARDLHAEAKAEVRHFVLPGITGSHDLALNAAFAEAARDEDAAQAL